MEFRKQERNYLQVKLRDDPAVWEGFTHPRLLGRHHLEEEGLLVLVFEPDEVNEILRAVLDFRPQAEILEAGLSPSPGPLLGYRLKLSPSLTLVSPGKGIQVQPGEIVIRANLSFGSGFHPTTALCARLMERAFARKEMETVFDLGTGSGVLALGAVQLGAPRVLAADIDFRACGEAKRNIALNQREKEILVVQGSVECARPQSFDLLLANLTIVTILTLAPELSRPLRPGGMMILSGFVEAQTEEVLAALPGRLLDQESFEGWTALLISP